MITINNLTLQFGDKHLFKEVSGRINTQDRIGLIGVNGTGKSTLMKMVAGIIETDYGVIVRAKRATIGYLPQEVSVIPEGRTLYEEAESSFADALSLQQELEEINHALSLIDPSSPDIPELLQAQGEIQHQLDQSDIFRMKSKIEKILVGLGFKESDFNKDCQTFSGGWLMRLMLAKHLLALPSFLLLDEPTNHLDIESLTWLEEFLKTYQGALVIISHDRTFLDNITTSTWELSLGKLTIYKGNYSKYIAEKEIRMEVQRAAYDNQQARIQQTMRFVTRFRAKSTKSSQVQSRLKQLSKLDRIELEDSEMAVSFRFPPAAPSGRLAVVVEHLTKSYEDKMVFNNMTFELQRGDKLAVVGVNGAGKSTLVKILAGLIKPDSGQIKLGHNVEISYFGQHQAQDLSPKLTVLETMNQIEIEQTITKVRSLLGAFLFRGDEVDKKVQVLSGGEKSRLALAKMIATPANLLIMDEPTNHLDMMSQEILQEAMKQYDGSIIVVSHNRYFVDRLVNKVLEIKNGRATMYEGNVTEYLAKTQSQRQSGEPGRKETTLNETAQKNIVVKARGKEARQAQAMQRQKVSKELAPLKKKVQVTEKEIELLESSKSELELALADPQLYNDQEAFSEKSNDYSRVDQKLKRLYADWEQTQAEIEKIEATMENDG
ncbi:MAG: ABC-F family ATP-binding cassette domain-containing protein [Proteobacteria bacterium]|nr:ABC-F family ATP-binding cassette domain-containing protein [Pseudomonadota bacterium]MBU1715966.1 ABC-F family ATP-binding cassette domain-containing protein [Pseudomonadota bacterium]